MSLGVIFDMDGVLVDSGPAHHQSWQRVAEQHGVAVSAEQFKQAFGRPSRDIIRLLWGDRVSDAEVAQYDAEKEVVYRELIGTKVPLMPGCRKLLTRLRQAGYTLGVATSGPPENLDLILSEGLIANYFDAEVHGFEVAVGKPAPDCFLLAADRLQVPPAKCVVIEDAPVGIAAALAAGMKVIGLAGTHAPERLKAAGANSVVRSLDEITSDLVRSVATAP